METRINNYKFAELSEEAENALKETCKKFAHDMRYDFQFEYYSVYFSEENWTLANLAMPEIDQILQKVQ
jgi:hypothetical protein